jgi:hypothetical protein
MVGRSLPHVVLCLAAALAAACGSSTSTSVTPPTTVRCQPGVSASSSAFGTAGGTGSLTVTVARECSWSASSEASWIVITSAREGQGDGVVTYRVNENADPVTRNGAISVNDQRVQLAQQAAPCRFSLQGPATVPAEGGQFNVSIGTHQVCAWTVQVPAEWATAQPNNGRGSSTVQVLVQPNPGAARTSVVQVEGERIQLTQTAATPGPSPTPEPDPPAPPPPPPSPGPTINLNGRATNVSGDCPTIQFTLDGRRVFTNDATQFQRGPCRAIEGGTRLEVQGREMLDGTVLADRVEFVRNDDDDDDGGDDDDDENAQ